MTHTPASRVHVAQSDAQSEKKHAAVSRVDLEALQWQVVMWSGEATHEEQQAFDQWLAMDPAHQSAWHRVQGLEREIGAVPGAVAAPALRAGLSPTGGNARRNVLRAMCLLAGGMTSAYVVGESGQWPALHADYSTARGERQDLTLPDGTRLSLNTASALDLRFDERERRVMLHSGEVLVTTAADRTSVHRPFIVQTREGSVRALGTRFLLRRLEDASPVQTSVQVFDGVVEIMPVHGAAPMRLAAGQRTRFSQRDAQAPSSADLQAAAWQRGLLVAEHLRLHVFLAELSRYRPGVVRCDPAVADLAVSGVYPLRDTDIILDALAQALPIRIQRRTRYWIAVTPA